MERGKLDQRKEVEQEVYALRLPSSREIVSSAEGGEDRVMVLEIKEKGVTAYLANEREMDQE